MLSLLLLSGCRWCFPGPHSEAAAEDECQRVTEAWEDIEKCPYVWGGESVEEGGFDCSGAVYYVQKAIGEPVPRTTAAKYYIMAGGEDKHWSEAGCGWWVWWQFSDSRPYGHIGMHARRPHAWQSGSSTGPARIEFFEGGYWDKRFKASKRTGQ